mgnify:CR=1 FL=1
MTGVSHSLRYALRSLGRSPAFCVAVVATLALGLGANTAIYSVLNAVLFRDVPFHDVERLVLVWETDRNSGTTREPASFPDFVDFETESRTLGAAAALMGSQVTVRHDDATAVRATAVRATHDLFDVLGVPGLAGRGFRPAEDRPAGLAVALVSEGFASRIFPHATDAIGASVLVDGQVTTVVGVVPPGADLGVLQILSAAAYARAFADQGDQATVDVWLPLKGSPESLPRQTHPLFMLARLSPSASVASAQAELDGIAAELEARYPVNDGRGVFVEPLTTVVFGPVRPALLLLTAAVGLVLLVACGNAANLLLARATARRREVALRRALGADGWRLATQFLWEGLLLGGAAWVAGLGLAAVVLDLLLSLGPADIPRLQQARLDPQVLGLSLLVTVSIGITLGFLPLLQSRLPDLAGSLRDAAWATVGRHGPRSALVAGQVALAVVLVVGAGLLIRSFWTLLQVDPGFASGGVLKAQFELPAERYPADMSRWPDFSETHAFNDELLRRVSAVDGVIAVAMAGDHPLDAGATNSFVVPGRESEAGDWPEISVRRVSPAYFRAVELALLRGRLFDPRDGGAAAPVAVINAAAARRFFAGRDPLGQRLGFWGAERTIVGVVADERFHGLDQPAPVAAYLPLAQAPSLGGAYALVARTETDPALLGPTLERMVRELDPELVLFGVEPLAETLGRSVAQRRFVLLLIGSLALLSLVLAAVGLQGLLGYDVARRTREIGIRVSLGATAGGVIGLVARRGAPLVATGLVAGVAASLVLARGLSSLLYGVRPADPVTLLAAPLVLAAVCGLAAVMPARRAARVDPTVALRSE